MARILGMSDRLDRYRSGRARDPPSRQGSRSVERLRQRRQELRVRLFLREAVEEQLDALVGPDR